VKNGNYEGAWERERQDRLYAELVTPVGYKHLGWLTGVIDASITEDYDSDTRIQGTVTTIEPESYIENAMVRLIHDSKWPNGTSSREVLGTFFVIRTREVWEHGACETVFELKSVLYGMKDDKAPEPMTLAQGSYGVDAFAKICNLCSRPKTALVSKNDKRKLEATTLDAGKSYLSWLHDVAEQDGMRVDVDVNGYVTYDLDRGFDQSPAMSLAYNSHVILDGTERTTDASTIASRSIVTWEYSYEVEVEDGVYKSAYTDSDGVYHAKGSTKYKKSTQKKPITAWADVDQGHPAHIGRRGWRKSEYHKYSGEEYGSNSSVSQAQRMAKELLTEDTAVTTEWSVSSLYIPDLHAGQVIRWKPPEGDWRLCLVTDLKKELHHFTMSFTLKEK